MMTETPATYLDTPTTPASRPLDGPPQPAWPWPEGPFLVAADLDVIRRRAAHKRERNARRDGRRQGRQ